MFELHDKIALVTGAAQGLGKGIALTLAEAGADIIVNDLKADERTDQLQEELKQLGVLVHIMEADVSREEAVQELFQEIESDYGKLDILVNNAGTAQAQDIFEISLSEWDRIIQTNLTSCFLCSQAAVKLMKNKGFGRIVSISSVVGLQGALYGHVHYAASKSGMLGFTKTLARTVAPFGITVNAVAPGVIQTELLQKTHGAEGIEKLADNVPLGMGKPEDVGYAVAFLCSEEARYLTGATIDVNGGMYMH